MRASMSFMRPFSSPNRDDGPVAGCRAGKGHPYPHGAAKCANCGGPHGARADACAAKRDAHGAAKGWRSPSLPRREKRPTEVPETPEDETPAAQEGLGGEVEVEMEVEPTPEGMEE